MNIWKKRYDEMIETCSLTARQRDEAIEDANDWKAEALKWKKQASSSLSLCVERIRPDSEGWWWRRYRGKNGDEWEIGKAEMIYWEDAGEPVQERVLAWSTGGCQTRCDYINLRSDSGTRWFKATPPTLDSENAGSDAPGAVEKP